MTSMIRAVVAAILLFLFAGCQTCEFVEAELRYHADRAAALETQVQHKDAEIVRLTAAIKELRDARAPTQALIPPEAVQRGTAMTQLVLRALTGAQDRDQDRVADGLRIVLAPIDSDGDALKCPGTAFVVLEERIDESRRRIGEWEFSPEALSGRWRTALAGPGYDLFVTWQTRPTQSRLHVMVRFVALHGRSFFAEKEVFVSTVTSVQP